MERQRTSVTRWASTIVAALLLSWAAAAGSQKPAPNDRVGVERIGVAYDDPNAAAKAVLLERINHDRAQAGAPPLVLEPRASKVGDLFCADQTGSGAVGHFDVAGRAPYLRWALGGGVDYQMENAGALSSSSGSFSESLEKLLLRCHDRMMAERPPADGHRQLILDPMFTHIGIGLSIKGGEFRMTEEFVRVAFDWLAVPTTPLRVKARAYFGGKPQPGFRVGGVEVRFEPPPRPLSLLEIAARDGYACPSVVRTLRPNPAQGTSDIAAGSSELSGGSGRFQVGAGTAWDFETAQDGSFELSFKLDQGPGSYVVVAYVRPSGPSGAPALPATTAVVTAIP
jgi:uncharacterized protein YkwD